MGRQYPLVVKHEDENLMYEIADYVDRLFKSFKNNLANQNESTIMVLGCLSIAEELFTMKKEMNYGPDQMEQINDRVRDLISQIKAEV